MLTEKKLNEAIRLYEELSGMDNNPLKQRVYNTLIKKRTLRRRIIFFCSCAAGLLLFLAAGVYTHFFTGIDRDNSSQLEVWSSESIVLTLSDGLSITLDDAADGTTVADESKALFRTENGALKVERKEDDRVLEETGIFNNTVLVPKGRQYYMMFEDGSRVWLNADSRLKFPSVFGNSERRIMIEGEACFQITPDVNKPFVVEAGGQTITVLGTEFNISAYTNDEVILTTLVSGRVLVTDRHGEERVLRPNEQSEFNRVSENTIVRNVNSADVIAWKDGLFAFDENTLEQVFVKLSRWYNIDVSYRDESLKGIVFKGKLPKYDDMTRILDFIEKSGVAKFEIKGNCVIIGK